MFKVYAERQGKEKELKHELSSHDREVLHNTLRVYDSNLTRAFYQFHTMFSSSESNVDSNDVPKSQLFYLCFKSSKEFIFSFLELLIHSYFGSPSQFKLIDSVKDYFKVRGLLYDLQLNEERGCYEIYQIASELMRERHEEAQALLLEKGWELEAKGISGAISDMKKGKGGYGSSLKSLYIVLEQAIKHAAQEAGIEKDNYEDKSIASVLNVLQKRGLLPGIEVGHCEEISEAIIKLQASLGGKRKEADHAQEVHPHEVLFLIYGVDNIICYLINELRELKNKKL